LLDDTHAPHLALPLHPLTASPYPSPFYEPASVKPFVFRKHSVPPDVIHVSGPR